MSTRIILISERTDDILFLGSVARSMECPLVVVSAANHGDLARTLRDGGPDIVCWDIDDIELRTSGHNFSFQAVTGILESTGQSRVFTVSDKPLYMYSQYFGDLFTPAVYFPNNIVRRYGWSACRVYSRVFRAALDPKPAGLATFFPPKTAISTLTLKKAEERKAATDAIDSFLRKLGTDARLSARAAQSADELLMNAIFSAGRDANNSATRHHLPRTEHFEFELREKVTLEMAWDENCAAILVSDNFGSVSPNVLLRHLSQNFRSKDYKPDRQSQHAGLGLYNTVLAGFGLCFIYSPGVRTDAMIFFQKSTSLKEFKQGFQFMACFKQDPQLKPAVTVASE